MKLNNSWLVKRVATTIAIFLFLYSACILCAVDIPLRIVSGVNSRSMSKPVSLTEGTIVWLDRYDFNSALWVKKGLIQSENDIEIIFKSKNGREKVLPRTIVAFNSVPNKNRLFFKLCESLKPFSETHNYCIRLISRNTHNEGKLRDVLVYREFISPLRHNVVFEKLNIAGAKAIRIEFRLSVCKIVSGLSVLQIARGYWFDAHKKVIGKFAKYVNPNPSGFFDVICQKKVPAGAQYLKLDIGLPKKVSGQIAINDLLILKGVFANTGCWQPRVEIVRQRFYPKIAIYTHHKRVRIDDDFLNSLKITNNLSDIVSADWMKRYIKVNDEGFVIQIEPTKLILVANDKRGEIYGRAYLERLKGRAVPSQIIIDWPVNRYRLMHVILWLSKVEKFTDRLDRYIKLCYDNRLNGIVLQSAAYWRIDEKKYSAAIDKIHRKIKQAGLDVVPLSWNFRDPISCKDVAESFNLSSGKWVQAEEYKLSNSPVFLKPKYDAYPMGRKSDNGYFPIVLITDESRFILKTANGKVLKEGKDYVLEGGWREGRYEPMAFRRCPNSSIREDMPVYASYNYLATIKGANPHWRQTCLSEPRAYQHVGNSVEITAKTLKPEFYHIGADEIITINRDSRDIVRKLSAGEIYADYITRVYNIIKNKDSAAKIIIWADAVNKYHARGWVGSRFPGLAEVAIRKIPNDIIVASWSDDYLDEHRIIDWFGRNKFCLWAAGGYLSVDKSVRWARELSIARRRKYKANGYIFTEWYAGDYLGLAEVSRYIWSSPIYFRIIDKDTICVYDPLSFIKRCNLSENVSAKSASKSVYIDVNSDNDINCDTKYYKIDLTDGYIEAEDIYGFFSRVNF